MSFAEAAGFLAIAGVAAYVQTLTGFAFGLIVMGGVGLTGLLPIPEAAVVVSVLSLVNVVHMLTKGWRDVLRRELALVLMSSLPLIFVGYLLLDHLAETRIGLLKVALGFVIILSSLQLIRPPKPRSPSARPFSFLAYGAAAGIMGGLFSTSGPPLVYHFHRLPLPLPAIRETLVAVFGANALVRLGLVAADGAFPAPAYWPAFLAVPAVMAGTHLARCLPPALSPRSFRLIVFLLLCASGLSLALPPGLASLRG